MTTNILHLASFAGNIGDVANHEGFYTQFRKLFSEDIFIEKLEIRMFYKNWRKKRFDDEFVQLVNQYDLLIIGGGNFFELCWDYSSTGTTVDLSTDILDKIKTPIFINGIGIDDNKGTNLENIEKFRRFLNDLCKRDNVFFTVRNDGSYKVVNKYFGEFSDFIFTIPDHGFFLNEVEEIRNYQPRKGKKVIGINIALDMAGIRYKNIDYKVIVATIAKKLNDFLDKTDYEVYLFPHIQSDFQAITDLIELIDNEFLRTRVSVTPLIQGKELETFKYYKECDMIFGMRFHSNVCSMSLGVPTLGLITYPKHGDLYDEIGLSERKINIESEDFLTTFGRELDNIMKDPKYLIELRQIYFVMMQEVHKQKNDVYKDLEQWINKFIK